VNIYSKCDLAAKRRLWENIVLVKNTFGDWVWCVVGDFNAVTSLALNLFNFFLLDVELNDVHPLGRTYTWYHANDRLMSRSHLILVLDEWINCWGSASLWILPRTISDHSSLLLKCGDRDWGPKPFRFNNFWLENRNFKKLVEEVWRGHGTTGWMRVVLKNKLRALKEEIRVCRKKEYNDLDTKVEKLIEDCRLGCKGGVWDVE
jgi:hypothetical protein